MTHNIIWRGMTWHEVAVQCSAVQSSSDWKKRSLTRAALKLEGLWLIEYGRRLQGVHVFLLYFFSNALSCPALSLQHFTCQPFSSSIRCIQKSDYPELKCSKFLENFLCAKNKTKFSSFFDFLWHWMAAEDKIELVWPQLVESMHLIEYISSNKMQCKYSHHVRR